jgi:hypothetical protein
VYIPVGEIEPLAGFKDQVTDWLVVPVILAVNCCVPLAATVAVPGVTKTLTVGVRVRAAFAILVESAALIASTSTVCAAVIVPGAV